MDILTWHLSYTPRQQRPNIILDLLFATSPQMFEPTGLKKKRGGGGGKNKKWFGNSFADLCVFTKLWFVVSGVVWKKIKFESCTT